MCAVRRRARGSGNAHAVAAGDGAGEGGGLCREVSDRPFQFLNGDGNLRIGTAAIKLTVIPGLLQDR